MRLSEEQIQRYSRHILLPAVGGKGQERWMDAAALVAFSPEAGGIAAAAAVYLAAAGMGRIGWLAGEAAAAPAGSLAPLADLYAPGGPSASAAALNADAALEELSEAEALSMEWDVVLLSDAGGGPSAIARHFAERGVPLFRAHREGWRGAIVRGADEIENDTQDFSPAGGEDLLPPAAPEGALGCLLAAAALRFLLEDENTESPKTVGSTAQARFDFAHGRFAGAVR